MTRRLVSGRFTALLLGLASFACGGGDSTGSDAPVATVTVTPNPVSVKVDSTVQLTATLKDADGTTLSGRTVTWSSDNTDVATVTGSGAVLGVSAGVADISATSEGKTGTTALSVTSSAPQSARNQVVVGPADKLPTDDFPLVDWPDPTDVVFDPWDIPDPPPLADPDDDVWDLPVPDLDFPPLGDIDDFGGISDIDFVRGGARALSVTGPDTTVLFTGGYKSSTGVASARRAVIYTPQTGLLRAVDMNDARIYHTTTRLSGARVLVVGGFDGDLVQASAEIYSDGTKTFTPTGSMSIARGRHAAARLPDGRVLVTGGLTPDGGGPATIDVKSTEIWDPATGTFSAGPDMSATRFNHSAIALLDGRVLVLGGNNRKSAEVYDPATNAFTPVGDMSVNHGLGARAVRLPDGKVLVTGGDLSINIQPSNVAEVFDPVTNTFTPVGNMTTTRMLHFAVLMESSGLVLVGGGQDASGDVLATTEVYDPATQSFSPAPDMPRAGAEQAAIYVRR